jgi:hypothetical protein
LASYRFRMIKQNVNRHLERIPLKSKHILHGERSSCIL